jgi:hypothetical protein
MPEPKLVVGDVVETEFGDEGTIVAFEAADDGTRVARVRHSDDSPSNPDGETLWAVDKLTREE